MAVVFLFQLFGIDLSFSELVIVVITATLAAIGAAGIPSAGLVTMVIVISAVNASLDGTGQYLPVAAIGVILPVHRIVDMCRTVVNVWGDATAAKVMTRLADQMMCRPPASTDPNSGPQSFAVQISLEVQCRTAAHARGGDGLSIDLIRHVAGGEDAGNVRCGCCQPPSSM